MKIQFRPILALAALTLSISALAEDSTKVISKMGDDGSESSSVLIEKTKNAKIRNDWEILSGEEEISGEPTAGTSAARKSWNDACKEWKAELKANNKDGQVLVANCGKPKFEKDEAFGAGAGIYTYTSNGTYKIKTRIRDK
jgi:hypothetical protein